MSPSLRLVGLLACCWASWAGPAPTVGDIPLGDFDITPHVAPRNRESSEKFRRLCSEDTPLNLGVASHAESSVRHLSAEDVQVYNPSVLSFDGNLIVIARSGGPPHDTVRAHARAPSFVHPALFLLLPQQ